MSKPTLDKPCRVCGKKVPAHHKSSICYSCKPVSHNRKERTCPTCLRSHIALTNECNRCRNEKRLKVGICSSCSKKTLNATSTSKCFSCCQEKGDKSHRWKGGKIKKGTSGYVKVYSPDHPRVSHWGKSGKYVPEHVLVMEKYLGRYLLQGENVHHKNGVRDDNRIENLELWTRPQPSGIRAEDALEWALEIVSRYAPHKLIL